MSKLNLYGNHRGGTSIVNHLPPEVTGLYDDDWRLADPKEDRAEKLARVVRDRFPTVSPRPLRMTAQSALAQTHDDDTLVMALDTVADTRDTLRARRQRQRATFQLVGRGPGGSAGTRTAIQGTLVPGDDDSERGAFLLLNTLEEMAQEGSSRVLTGPDPLTAATLRPMRDLATRQTVRHLLEKDRDPWHLSRGPLSVTFGTTVYPLVAVQGRPQDRFTHRKDLALDAAGMRPTGQFVERGALGRFLIVAVVIPEDSTIQFMSVGQNRAGKRRVNGVTVFAPLAPMAGLWETNTSAPFSSIDAAVFTD